MKEIYKIYNMTLFETVIMKDLKILRVPGGWLFTQTNYFDTAMKQNNSTWGTTVFVPFDNEFQEAKKEDAMSSIFSKKYLRVVKWE